MRQLAGVVAGSDRRVRWFPRFRFHQRTHRFLRLGRIRGDPWLRDNGSSRWRPCVAGTLSDIRRSFGRVVRIRREGRIVLRRGKRSQRGVFQFRTFLRNAFLYGIFERGSRRKIATCLVVAAGLSNRSSSSDESKTTDDCSECCVFQLVNCNEDRPVSVHGSARVISQIAFRFIKTSFAAADLIASSPKT